jgi:ATP-dependent exoDNAse (exonuclease V) alpha subunit
MSVHRYQGSEYLCVVIPTTTSARMLQRNLLYAAITRAKLVVVVGSKKPSVKQYAPSTSDAATPP